MARGDRKRISTEMLYNTMSIIKDSKWVITQPVAQCRYALS